LGALLLNFGYISRAAGCFKHVLDFDPYIWRAQLNMANAACDAGQHAVAVGLYRNLQTKQPNHPMIHRNVLVSQQYNSNISNADLLDRAKGWEVYGVDGQLCGAMVHI
jgi:lipopolysaccharide biosynthesis regulator YciM